MTTGDAKTPTETKATTSNPPEQQTWKLPEGTEEALESGIVKAAVGAVAGGLVGAILFRSGKGMRAGSMALGVGVAVGSTVERALSNEFTPSKTS
jgi:hypothetical protein